MENQNDMNKLVELAKKLEQQKATKKDYIIPSEQIESIYDVGERKLKLSIPIAMIASAIDALDRKGMIT